MQVEVATWHLEMRDAGQPRPKLSDRADLAIRQAQIPCPEFSRFLYTSVGGHWHWYSRLDWSYDRWPVPHRTIQRTRNVPITAHRRF